MKKIGIISEFNMRTVNYGNNLQAYAMNRVVNSYFQGYRAESIYFETFQAGNKIKQTAQISSKLYRKVIHKLRRIPYKLTDSRNTFLKKRWDSFIVFAKENIEISEKAMDWQALTESEYDAFIVGSDVVWSTSPGVVNRIKFLDFGNKRNAKRIAYAASFGSNEIPKENTEYIKLVLKDFTSISVRERSAVSLLSSIGVLNVVHVPDPTLLLTRQDWEEIACCPQSLSVKNGKDFYVERNRYLFAYLLDADVTQKNAIKQYAKIHDLYVISIPYANGYWNFTDYCFGDALAWDCSPEEWIWLIAHAELVVTDSFHGIIFSTIFQKKFIAQRRLGDKNLNNRIDDYLESIGEKDKVCTNLSLIDSMETMVWNYQQIQEKLEKFKRQGWDFLKRTYSCLCKEVDENLSR